MSIVTLEHLRLRMEREFFTGALADLDAAKALLGAPPLAGGPTPDWSALPAARAELRRAKPGSARRLATALRRDRACLQRRLAALKAELGAAEPWMTLAAERLAEPRHREAPPEEAHLDPAHA